MSSEYRVLCLSHNPATIASGGHRRPEEVEQAVADGIEGHEKCDLLIGRYSYPLIEVGCPRSAPGGHRLWTCCHSDTQWIEVDWLRLLFAVEHLDPESRASQVAAAANFRCWPNRRLNRLRVELGMAEQ